MPNEQGSSAAELALEYALDFFARYQKSVGGASELLPDLAATQAAFFKTVAEEMKEGKNSDARRAFQREFVKIFFQAGMELFKEARVQRERWEALENTMLGHFKNAMENLPKEEKPPAAATGKGETRSPKGKTGPK